MIVEFIVRVTMEIPDNKDINNLYFGDVAAIHERGINNTLIDYETESVKELEGD